MTLRSENFASAVRMSSCTPSVKNAFSLSSLRLAKGSTAMLFWGRTIFAAELLAGTGGGSWVLLRQRKSAARLSTSTAAVAHQIERKLLRCIVAGTTEAVSL